MSKDQPLIPIEAALPADRAGILRVMAFFNMHHVPGPEMGELELEHFFVVRAPKDPALWPAEAAGPAASVPGFSEANTQSAPSLCPGDIVGASGWKMIAPGRGKTTLLGVDPAWSSLGLGGRLQDARVHRMRSLGARTVLTNADRPESIRWYMKHYGCRVIGRIAKVADFGLCSVDYWTTLELDLDAFYQDKAEDPLPPGAPELAGLPPLASHYDYEVWDGGSAPAERPPAD